MKKNIKHIVYLMLENRSLDHVLGWLYDQDKPSNFIPKTNTDPYNGLNNNGPFFNPDGKGGYILASKIGLSQGQQIPAEDPHEEFQYVQRQIAVTNCVEMGGFYQDFATTKSKNPKEIMECYTPESLPVLNSLAKKFGVSDTYFSSIPTQTNCNRAFAATGNSIGYNYYSPHILEAWVNNSFGEVEKWALDVTFNQRTIWDVIDSDLGPDGRPRHDWKIYYNHTWPVSMWPFEYCFTQDLFWPTLGKKSKHHFQTIDTFMQQAREGTLPEFSFIEPAWFLEEFGIGYNGNDYHPPGNVGCGEQFLHKLYEALQSNQEAWSQTLFIINFDEHGGTYDHVTPPTKNIAPPWEDLSNGTPVPQKKEKDFEFNRLGVRVPLILVSPLIEEKTLVRSQNGAPFDHTSVLATILELMEIPKEQWKLGTRTHRAATFEEAITLTPEQARLNVQIANPISDTCKSDKPSPPSELQWMVMHRCFARVIDHHDFPKERFRELYEEHFQSIEHMDHMNEAARKIMSMMEKEIKKM
ncbi:MAG: hypothetical protein EP338_09105 [Bacteroidetes bacterium]|nr:MAG: hypothetical protein EP338_09105 [Bacteroidota bacterium]